MRSSEIFSGAERYNTLLIPQLRKDKKLRIDFLTNQTLLAEKLHVPVTPWLFEEVGTKKQLLKILFQLPFVLHKYINALIHYDLVCFQSRTEMIFLTPIAWLLHKKVVWIQHGPFFVSQASRIIKWLYRIASRYATIVAVSQDTKSDLTKNGGNLVEVIYIGVKTQEIRKIKYKNFTIGFLGALTKEKGTDDFVRVCCYYMRGRASIDNIEFFVIGDGPEKRSMMRQLPAVFTGYVEDVKKYLKEIDILLFPTHHHEGISLAILEAMAMGIPVLATDIGGCWEVIKDGYNGFLYKQGDVEKMARDIRMLNKNRAKLRLMGKHARETVVKRFNIEIQAKKFAEFFKSL